MSSKSEIDEGIKLIKSAWQREHTARVNLEKMLENAEAENEKLRELCEGMLVCYEPCNRSLDVRTDCPLYDDGEPLRCRKARLLRELGIEVD